MLKSSIQHFSTPKANNQPAENEDAVNHDEKVGRLAVADGASDAFESRLWAWALVEAFVRQSPALKDDEEQGKKLLQWLEGPIEEWKGGIHWEKLTWYQEEKARRGAFATLLGLVLDRPAGADELFGCWSALAIGDTCLFQIREDQVKICFPMERSEDFGVTPFLLSTSREYNRRSVVGGLRTCEGSYCPGDLFVLATDALAQWFLRQIEAGEKPWNELKDLNADTFQQFLEHLRSMRDMRNDDVTLVLVQIDNTDNEMSDELLR